MEGGNGATLTGGGVYPRKGVSRGVVVYNKANATRRGGRNKRREKRNMGDLYFCHKVR